MRLCQAEDTPANPAMHVPTRVTTTWAFAALFAAAIGVGEGWHFVPGNGHLVELPGGYLCVGITLPRVPPGFLDGRPVLDNGQRESIPCEDEGDCIICRLSGQGKSRAETVDFVAATPLGQDSPPAAFSAFCKPILPPFRARAPPLA